MKDKFLKIIKPVSVIIFTLLLCFSVYGCARKADTVAYSKYAVQLDTEADESFLFFTDPHLMQSKGVIDSDYVEGKLNYIKNFYDKMQLNFIVCGGDWYDGETEVDFAKQKLKFASDYMYGNFDNYYPVVGNHDTNYQGTERLNIEDIIQSQCYNHGSTYYDFNGKNTHFYVLDTGSDWDTGMTEARSEQIEWFAEKVKEDEGNVAIISHMYYYFHQERVCVLNKEIAKICQAFNKRQTYGYKEKTYDYSECQGKVRFMLAGHTHEDYTVIAEDTDDIPVIGTMNLIRGGKVNFELVNVNYAEGKIKLIRVGNGQNREVDLAA